jgi:hypothetical protein
MSGINDFGASKFLTTAQTTSPTHILAEALARTSSQIKRYCETHPDSDLTFQYCRNRIASKLRTASEMAIGAEADPYEIVDCLNGVMSDFHDMSGKGEICPQSFDKHYADVCGIFARLEDAYPSLEIRAGRPARSKSGPVVSLVPAK